jgi:hypothetical protein
MNSHKSDIQYDLGRTAGGVAISQQTAENAVIIGGIANYQLLGKRIISHETPFSGRYSCSLEIGLQIEELRRGKTDLYKFPLGSAALYNGDFIEQFGTERVGTCHKLRVLSHARRLTYQECQDPNQAAWYAHRHVLVSFSKAQRQHHLRAQPDWWMILLAGTLLGLRVNANSDNETERSSQGHAYSGVTKRRSKCGAEPRA